MAKKIAIQIELLGYASEETKPPATPMRLARASRDFELVTSKAYLLAVVAVSDNAALDRIDSLLGGVGKFCILGLGNLVEQINDLF